MGAAGWLRWWRVLAILLTLGLESALIGLSFDADWAPTDDGNYAHVAERLAKGEVLHRDVQDIHAGYVNFANAAALSLFGFSMRSLRLPIAALTLLQGVLVLWLFRCRGAATAAAASLVCVGLGALQFFNPTAHWYALFVFFFVVVVLVEKAPGSRGRIELVGFALGVLFLFRQLSGVLATIGVVAYLLLEASTPSSSHRAPWLGRGAFAVLLAGLGGYLLVATDASGLALFGIWPIGLLIWGLARVRIAGRQIADLVARLGLGAVVAALPLLLYHLAHGSLRSWYEDVVVTPGAMLQLDFFDQTDFGQLVSSGLALTFGGEGWVAGASGLYWVLLPLLSVLAGGLACKVLSRSEAQAVRGRALPFLAVFWAVVSVHYQIPIYLYYSVAPTLLGLLWLAAETSSRTYRLVWCLAAYLVGVGVLVHAGQSAAGDWDDLMTGRRIDLVPSRGLDRCGLRIPPDQLAVYRQLIHRLWDEAAPGEPVFVVPTDAEIYFLADRPNPTRFFNFALGVRDEAALEALERRFTIDPPRAIVIRRDDKYNTDLSDRFISRVEAEAELLGTFGPFSLYRPQRPPRGGGR